MGKQCGAWGWHGRIVVGDGGAAYSAAFAQTGAQYKSVT